MNLLIIYLKTQQFSISCYSICCINTNRHQQTVVVGFPATEDAFMRAETPSGRLSGADRKGSTRFFFNYLIFSKCGWERLVFFQRRWGTYFSRSALGPVQRRPLLGFAEVRVVRVTAPQLFARVKGSKLKPDKEERKQIHVTSCLLGKMWAWPIKIWNRINPTLAMSFYCWWNSDVHVTLMGFTAVHVVSHDALWETLKTLICCLFWTHCRSAVGPGGEKLPQLHSSHPKCSSLQGKRWPTLQKINERTPKADLCGAEWHLFSAQNLNLGQTDTAVLFLSMFPVAVAMPEKRRQTWGGLCGDDLAEERRFRRSWETSEQQSQTTNNPQSPGKTKRCSLYHWQIC